MCQINGIVRTHCTECFVRLKAFHGLFRHFQPLILVPSPACDPVSWLGYGGSFRYFFNQLLVGFHPHQVNFKFVVSDTHQMRMGFDDSWRHRLALKVNYLGAASNISLNFRCGANSEDQSIFDGHGLHLGIGFIHRVHDAIDKYLIGRCRARLAAPDR